MPWEKQYQSSAQIDELHCDYPRIVGANISWVQYINTTNCTEDPVAFSSLYY